MGQGWSMKVGSLIIAVRIIFSFFITLFIHSLTVTAGSIMLVEAQKKTQTLEEIDGRHQLWTLPRHVAG